METVIPLAKQQLKGNIQTESEISACRSVRVAHRMTARVASAHCKVTERQFARMRMLLETLGKQEKTGIDQMVLL